MLRKFTHTDYLFYFGLVDITRGSPRGDAERLFRANLAQICSFKLQALQGFWLRLGFPKITSDLRDYFSARCS
jgi:hypothetical protein